ncbi:MAG: sugar ABC transporter permease [Caldilineaceae bacterium SB0675_bin_29]|uniref:Sugar ABC transporter permease n=1 Tax=Caldilineaceae bacterium SB0675_bin_29 TaxID=2605266 RepID=A0A6B1G3K9_9CHLR|nr:sugar ABC transporter permease [Caldilineaceae bacterium]MYH63519.1 sugar ABC transporter permease [Caldilineaceae bacterium SB0675_bin_29]
MVKRPAILRSLRARETFWFYVFASPWILGFLLFYLGPMIASFGLSLTNYSVLLPTRFMGLSNYSAMFEDNLLGISIWNTAYYAALAVPTSMAAGLGLAMVLNRGDLRGRSFLRSAFYVPAIMPLVAVSILWIWLLQPRFGLINTLLYFLSIKGPNWLGDPAWSKPGLVVMNLTGVGINMVIFLAALQGVPTHLYEAAELDGANRLRKFWHVTIPMISPAIFFVVVIGFINSFQVFTQAYIMTEGGPADSTLFYVLYLYRHAFNYFKMGYASAMAWLLFIVIVVLTYIQFRLSLRWVHYGGQ